MAAGDQQKRCSNCIKLKRECHFQPVDNQPGDRRSRANSKSDFLSDMSAESSPVQAHSIGQMDASLDSYPATSMMPGFDPSIAVYGDGLPRASTWNGVEYVDHGNMQPTDHISVDPYGVPFNATSMSIDSESITTLSRPQSNHWASNTPPLSTFHGHAISYPVSQSGIEGKSRRAIASRRNLLLTTTFSDLVSLPTSTNGGAHNWPTGFQNHPSMYSRNQMSYSAGYQDPLHHHYESPRVQASYHSR